MDMKTYNEDNFRFKIDKFDNSITRTNEMPNLNSKVNYLIKKLITLVLKIIHMMKTNQKIFMKEFLKIKSQKNIIYLVTSKT